MRLRLSSTYVDRGVGSEVGEAQRGLNGSRIRDTAGVVVNPPDVVVAIDSGVENWRGGDGLVPEPGVRGLIDAATDERGGKGSWSGGDGR